MRLQAGVTWLLLAAACACSSGAPVGPAEGPAPSPGNVTATVHPSTRHGSSGFAKNGSSISPEFLQLGNANNTNGETSAELQSDLGIAEGDIILKDDRNAVDMLWSNGVVPYTVGSELASRLAEIQEAMRMIMAATCIQFVEYTNQYNHIEIKGGNGCASFVGVRGGAQPVFFSDTCSVGNLCHELMHGLGLYHEHTRSDRDQYISVNWPNIQPGKTANFEVKTGNTLNLPYDYQSIMHYGLNYFSVDGNPTIETKGSAPEVGQRTRLTQLDIMKLNTLYRC